jgi:small subunit ribosomal protein S13
MSAKKTVRRVKRSKVKKKERKVKAVKKKKAIEGIRGIVRLVEVDIPGEKKIRNALLHVKGIGHSLAKAIPLAAGLDPEIMIGSLNDEQLKKLEDVIKNPLKYNIPYHMLNRRFDPITGEHKHLTGSELVFTVKSDIDLMKKIRSYKGIRHELGLPVRGQRTRTSFRKGMIVGVSRKKEKKKKKSSS